MDTVEKIKLTPKQNDVIWCLQNGWVLITDSSSKGAIVAIAQKEYKINNGVFWNLVDKGLIYQGFAIYRFNYILTDLGKSIKTKPMAQ